MAIFFSAIFLSAGSISYLPGLIYTIIGIIMFLLNYTVLRVDAGLESERSQPGENAKKWDKAILGLSFLVSIGMYITAGLDSGRFHWSPPFHPCWLVAGSVLTVSGQLLFLVAQKQNKFFSSTVRIQQERGHTVCDTGLYKCVRHPAYLGSVIQVLGLPALFGSLWSILPVMVMIVLLVARTYKEDITLKEELSGYADYTNKTRYRLLPYIW